MDALEAFVTAARHEVDAALDRYLPRPPDCPEIISEAMRYSVMAGGKRFRPVLALAAAEAVAVQQGLPPTAARALALPAACAIEMIHTYSLIHDDLPAMDNDVMRRGRPTLHVVFGEGLAILAGDGLHAEAFGLLAREPVSDDREIVARKLRTLAAIADAAGSAGMVGGQTIDLEAIRRAPDRAATPPLDAPALEEMHRRKTGALITASTLAGAVMAGADERTLSAMTAYGREIGLAFQIVDDILDVKGATEELGKTSGKDAAAGKPTYPALLGMECSEAIAAACIDRAEAAMARARLSDSMLPALARRILSRTS